MGAKDDASMDAEENASKFIRIYINQYQIYTLSKLPINRDQTGTLFIEGQQYKKEFFSCVENALNQWVEILLKEPYDIGIVKEIAAHAYNYDPSKSKITIKVNHMESLAYIKLRHLGIIDSILRSMDLVEQLDVVNMHFTTITKDILKGIVGSMKLTAAFDIVKTSFYWSPNFYQSFLQDKSIICGFLVSTTIIDSMKIILSNGNDLDNVNTYLFLGSMIIGLLAEATVGIPVKFLARTAVVTLTLSLLYDNYHYDNDNKSEIVINNQDLHNSQQDDICKLDTENIKTELYINICPLTEAGDVQQDIDDIMFI